MRIKSFILATILVAFMGLWGSSLAQTPAQPAEPAPVAQPAQPAAVPEATPAPAVDVKPVANETEAKDQVAKGTPEQAMDMIALIKWSYLNGSWLILVCAVVMLGFGVMNKVKWAPTIPTKWMPYAAFASAFAITFATNVLAGEPMLNCLLTAILAGWGAVGAYSVGGKLLVKHPGEAQPAQPVAPAAPVA